MQLSPGQEMFSRIVDAKHRREDQSAGISKLRFLLASAREKMELYRSAHSGEYLGGMEYSELKRQIDAALPQ